MEFSDLKVLLMEDNEFVRSMVRKYLMSFGIENITECEDGQGGIDFLKIQTPDVIISDIAMQPKSGFDFLEELRDMPEPYSSIPVLLLTGDSHEETVLHAKGLEISGYLVKPVTAEALKTRIKRIMH